MSAGRPCLDSKGKPKKSYESKWEADDVAAHRQSEDSKAALRVYECPDFKHWHLTDDNK